MEYIQCCDNCNYLLPKEEEQSVGSLLGKEPHLCKFYKKQVKHIGHHPHIPTPEWCNIIKDLESDLKKAEELLAEAWVTLELYAPNHPLVEKLDDYFTTDYFKDR